MTRSAWSGRSAPICSIRCSRRVRGRLAVCSNPGQSSPEYPAAIAAAARTASRRRNRPTPSPSSPAAACQCVGRVRKRLRNSSLPKDRSAPPVDRRSGARRLDCRRSRSSGRARPARAAGSARSRHRRDRVSSRFDSCSILIACCSCGVMTSVCVWRSSSRCEKPILFTQALRPGAAYRLNLSPR